MPANDALRELLARDLGDDGVPEDAKPTPTIYPGTSALPPAAAYIPRPDWRAEEELALKEAAERRRQAETAAAQDEHEREPPPQPPARKWRRR